MKIFKIFITLPLNIRNANIIFPAFKLFVAAGRMKQTGSIARIQVHSEWTVTTVPFLR